MKSEIRKGHYDRIIKGYLMILLSAFLFTISTVAAKYLNNKNTIGGVELSFARFFLGAVLVLFMRFVLKYKINPINKKGLYLRAILNAGAVILFFLAVQYSTITNANLLNMSYPVFVAISSYFWLNEEINAKIILSLILAILGAILIIKPFYLKINFGDVYGVLSAVIAGLAITDLKYVRKTDDTFTIMYYLFIYGALFTFVFCFRNLKIPSFSEPIFILISAVSAIIGQFVLTYGQKYCTATQGSIISMSRILIAAIFGILLFDDKIDIFLITGAVFIILPNILLFYKN